MLNTNNQMNPIDNCILGHSYFVSKDIVKVLREQNFQRSSYTDKEDILSICSIIERHLISLFTDIVKDLVKSFDDVVMFMQLYSANPNPHLKKMLSFRQTCRYIFYLSPLLKLSSKPSEKRDVENMNEFCKLIAINNLIQELNQAYGIQSLLDNSCLKITLDGYYSINYTDPFVLRLNTELSNSTNLIHKEFFSEDIFNQLMKTLEEASLPVKQIFDFTQDFWFSPADVFEVTEQTLDTDDSIIRGLAFDNDNVNLLQAIEKPLNPQFRTRFRPLICMNIDGRKRTFTSSWMVREALEEICTNLLPYGTLPIEWGNIDTLRKLALKVQEDLGKQFENEVAERIKGRYLVKSDISGFNHISLKDQKVPNSNRTVGQIDAIAIDSTRKIIYIIDAKCTKTKYFFQTFLTDKQSFEKYSIKLNDKVDWIAAHKDVVAKYFKIASFDEFKVEGLFVSNSLVYFGFFSKIPIIPLDKLLAYLEMKDMKVLFD